eukprot:gnl/TRDRNA2_/TRDRNA2_36566_c0_seq1.p1 gnl/TRDRNA2_/TRDRNA2_36566_c0~~gnl/TRDRNA2_/TRDRNA2_36566_c0_seq1.p1  ORF type:complete len:505 (+),score=88.98 gnl/TRDRNA2_/TRDRNA2_36566_c0_seq1:59-1573(+)
MATVPITSRVLVTAFLLAISADGKAVIHPTDEAALIQKEIQIGQKTMIMTDKLSYETEGKELSELGESSESLAQHFIKFIGKSSDERGFASSMAGKAGPAIAKPEYCFAPDVHMNVQAPKGLQLKQVQVVFRHGIRTAAGGKLPNQTFPLSTNCSLDHELSSFTTHWPKLFKRVAEPDPSFPIGDLNAEPAKEADGFTCKGGELTPQGVREMRGLGRKLGKAYGERLSFGELSPEDIYARSTAVHRTLGSLTSVLSGMFEVNGGFDTAEKRGPFTLGVRDMSYETMFGVGCARVGGSSPPADISVVLADTSLSSVCEFGAGPCFGEDKCLTPSQFSSLKQAADSAWCDQILPKSEEAKQANKLRNLPILHEITSRMRKKLNGAAPRLALYSGHDISVAPLAAALGFGECKWIPTGSHIVFELWSSGATDKLRVLYNGQSVTSKISDCDVGSEFCDLSAFEAAVNNFHKELGFATYHEACALAAGQKGGPAAAYDVAHKVDLKSD